MNKETRTLETNLRFWLEQASKEGYPNSTCYAESANARHMAHLPVRRIVEASQVGLQFPSQYLKLSQLAIAEAGDWSICTSIAALLIYSHSHCCDFPHPFTLWHTKAAIGVFLFSIVMQPSVPSRPSICRCHSCPRDLELVLRFQRHDTTSTEKKYKNKQTVLLALHYFLLSAKVLGEVLANDEV